MPFAFKIRTFDLRISVYVTLLSNSGIESMLLKISIVNICNYIIVTYQVPKTWILEVYN